MLEVDRRMKRIRTLGLTLVGWRGSWRAWTAVVWLVGLLIATAACGAVNGQDEKPAAEESATPGTQDVPVGEANSDTATELEQPAVTTFCPEDVPGAIAGDSRAKGTLIVVWKAEYKLGFYNKGKLGVVSEGGEPACFDVALGGAPEGPKLQQGDQKTPEGWYWVSWKIPLGSTSYYKALYVNYPNASDAAKGLASGLIDQRMHDRIVSAAGKHSTVTDSALGALIEIHGSGSQPPNWTLGCIALDNPNMDYLYDATVSGQTAIYILP